MTLPRFAKVIARRVEELQSDEQIAVIGAELQLVRAELAMLRPPPHDPLKLESDRNW